MTKCPVCGKKLCSYQVLKYCMMAIGVALGLFLAAMLSASEAHAKSFWDMTPAERREAAAQRERDKYTPQERVRWACSDLIARKVPGAEWVRRTAWPVVQTEPGVWSVAATFSAYNVRGVPHHQSTMCRIQLFTK